jgi:isoquinoline 1-oxidoreductase alpha subunit
MSTARRYGLARSAYRKWPARRSPPSKGLSPNGQHLLQKAWIAEQVPQCGYCQSGQIMQAATLLATNKKPTRDQIVAHMDGNICRCGTYPRIVRAIQRAAREA